MAARRRYTVEEAAELVLLAESDDEVQDDPDSDEEDVLEMIESEESDENEEEHRNLVGRDGTQWDNNPPPVRRARRENVFCARVGPAQNIQTKQTPTEVFQEFISNEIIALIVHHTNRNATAMLPDLPPWYNERWTPIDDVEAKSVVGLLILCGVLKSAHEIIIIIIF